MNTINLFSTPIYKVQYPGNTAKILDSINDIILNLDNINNQSNMRGNGYCSYNTKKDLHTLPQLQELVTWINEQATIYWQEIGYDKNKQPGVYEMWTNVYKQDSYIELHNHSPIHMTASFYLQLPNNGGNLIFENPLSTLLKHQPYDLDSIRYTNIFEHETVVNTGDLVIFPGYLSHKTIPNSSNKDRIILGANVCNVI